MGHSFGAFLSSKYALRFPQHVNKLVLFSPWASEMNTEEHKIKFDKQIDDLPITKKWLYGLVKWAYDTSSPFEVARKGGRLFGGYFLKSVLTRKFKKLDEEERDAFIEYMHQIIMKKGSSEYGFGKMFPNFMYSDKAIGNHIHEYKNYGIEVSFYYGTHDWMDTDFNGDKISNQLMDAREKVYLIDDASHHIYFCNPKDAFYSILDDFKTSKVVKMD